MGILYNNEIRKTKKNITIEDILSLEKAYDFIFPNDIRDHYLTYNGGEPQKYIFRDEDGDEYVVQNLIPIKYTNQHGTGDLDFSLKNLRMDEILPTWLIPFAKDPSGNLFCFSINKDEEGAIYFWDHEYEFGEDPEEYVIYLTESIKRFIDSMVEDE